MVVGIGQKKGRAFHKAGQARLSETKSASSKVLSIVPLSKWMHHRPLDWDMKAQQTPRGCFLLLRSHFTYGKTEIQRSELTFPRSHSKFKQWTTLAQGQIPPDPLLWRICHSAFDKLFQPKETPSTHINMQNMH